MERGEIFPAVRASCDALFLAGCQTLKSRIVHIVTPGPADFRIVGKNY